MTQVLVRTAVSTTSSSRLPRGTTSSATLAPLTRFYPTRGRTTILVTGPVVDEGDEDVRAYVSRLWAEDWDSDDDAIYDSW